MKSTKVPLWVSFHAEDFWAFASSIPRCASVAARESQRLRGTWITRQLAVQKVHGYSHWAPVGVGDGGWRDDELLPEMGSMRCKIVENNLVILMVILRTTHILLVAQSTHASNLTFPYTGHWTDPVLNQGLWGVFILVLCNLAMLEEGFLSVFRLYNK